MKLSLKNVEGRLKLLVKNTLGKLKLVMDCCCVGDDLVEPYSECCDGGLTVYVPQAMIQGLGCPSEVVIKLLGSCFRRTTMEPIRRAVAIQLGYRVIDGTVTIECANTCQTEPCPVCPDNCCIIRHIPATCEETNGQLICCNRGSYIHVVARKDIHRNYTGFTSVNGSDDGYCPPGCNWGYESIRVDDTEYDEWNGTYKKCDESGSAEYPTVTCSRNLLNTHNQIDTHYGFEGGVAGPCLASVETPTYSEYRDDACNGYMPMTVADDWLPPPYYTPNGAGPFCTLDGYQEVYDNIPGKRQTCTYSLNRSRECFTGSYVLQIDCVTRIHPNAPLESCPPPNAVTAYSSNREVYEYSILKLSDHFCNPSFCDGPGGRPPRFPDFNVDNGALVLL